MTLVDIDVSVADGISLITPDRLLSLAQVALSCADVQGDVIELGVYRGGSVLVLNQCFSGKRFLLYDTFAGLPHSETKERDEEGFCPEGRFVADYDEVLQRLKHVDYSVYKGVFPNTFHKGSVLCGLAFAHIDCDLYDGAKSAIELLWPLVHTGGAMYFDDYGCDFTGVTEAVNEKFDEATEVNKMYDVHGYQIGAWVRKQL